MDIENIRLKNLDTLIQEAGSKKRLATISKTNCNYLSQVHAAKRRPHSKLTRIRRLGPDVCRKLERATGKPFGWMDEEHEELAAEKKKIRVRYVPILEWSEVANWQALSAKDLAMKRMTIYKDEDAILGQNALAVIVKDDSMFDPSPHGTSFPMGAEVTFDPDIAPAPTDFVVVKLPGVPTPIIRQYMHDGVRAFIKAVNPMYHSRGAEELPADATIIGVVVQVSVRTYRPKSAN